MGEAHEGSLERRSIPEPATGHVDTGISERQRIVVRDAATWAQLWRTITSGYSPPPPVPEVDFDSEMAIVAAMGTRPSGGYSIHIDEVREAGEQLHVVVREVSPGPDCLVSAALTAPVIAVRVARRDGPVTFVEHAEVVDCD
jgi:hypothetical protein